MINEVREGVCKRHQTNGEGRDPGSPHECETRQNSDREVEGADIADEVLIVRTIGRDPHVPEPRKYLVKCARKKQRPDSDEQTNHTKQRQRESACRCTSLIQAQTVSRSEFSSSRLRLSASRNCIPPGRFHSFCQLIYPRSSAVPSRKPGPNRPRDSSFEAKPLMLD
jgi:hypothetical protein